MIDPILFCIGNGRVVGIVSFEINAIFVHFIARSRLFDHWIINPKDSKFTLFKISKIQKKTTHKRFGTEDTNFAL